ncbi:hypothetical protein [Amycolatopsis sp. NPDC058986]|uniref:hypothetical protein n=1 Tax=unclassified Amycolatopsis TaxID=2618356 RepID=UPI00366CFE46
MGDPRDDVARLCAGLALLRKYAPDDVSGLIEQAKDGRLTAESLDSVLAKVHGPPPPSVWRGDQPGPALLGRFGRRSAHEVYVCPSSRCSRVTPRRSGEPAPTCHLDEARLRPTKL